MSLILSLKRSDEVPWGSYLKQENLHSVTGKGGYPGGFLAEIGQFCDQIEGGMKKTTKAETFWEKISLEWSFLKKLGYMGYNGVFNKKWEFLPKFCQFPHTW